MLSLALSLSHTHTHTHTCHLLSDSICSRLLEVTAALRAEESEQELNVSEVASCSIIPGLETLHIIFLIKSLTIPYVRREGRQIEKKKRMYVSVKKKRGKGSESKKKGQ